MFFFYFILFIFSANAEDGPSKKESLDGMKIDLEEPKKAHRIWYKPNSVLKSYGGWSYYQLSHGSSGMRWEKRLAKSLFLDIDGGLLFGQKKAYRSDEGWPYMLVPFAMGIGWKLNEGQRVHPNFNVGLSGLLYHMDPLSKIPSFGVGLYGRMGFEVLFTKRLGFFMELEPAVVYAKSIKVVVDPDFGGIASQFTFRSGFLIQL